MIKKTETPRKPIHPLSFEKKKPLKTYKQLKEPFLHQISREKAIEQRKIKHPPPPIGQYNPKYKEIDPLVHHSRLFYALGNSTSRKAQTPLGDLAHEMVTLPEKIAPKVPSKFIKKRFMAVLSSISLLRENLTWLPLPPMKTDFFLLKTLFTIRKIKDPKFLKWKNVLF